MQDLFHFVEYGQPGRKQTSRVTPPEDDWAKSFSKPKSAAWHVTLDPDAFQTLFLGFQPAEMEDKWVIFTTGPDSKGNLSLHMHRSWTGYKIFELSIKLAENEIVKTDAKRAHITAISWETDPDFYIDVDAEHAKETVREICRWVMGVNLGSVEAPTNSSQWQVAHRRIWRSFVQCISINGLTDDDIPDHKA